MKLMTTHAPVYPGRSHGKYLGSLFTDWRNSVESALTGGASDKMPSVNIPLSLTTPQNTPPRPVVKAPATLFGMPIATVGMGAVALYFVARALR
jgi:hypothetical protein